jgi:hypothetical protein
MSEGFHQGRELGLPLIHFRIEASELNRDDLKTVTPISQEPAVVPADVREFHEEFERARQKAMKGNRLSFSWSARLSAK